MTEYVRCIFQTEKKKSNMIYDEEGWDQIRDTWMAQDEALKQIGHSESTAFSRIIKAFLAGEKNLAFSPTTVLYALLLLGQMTEGECRREIYDALSCAPESSLLMLRNILDSVSGQTCVASASVSASLWANSSYPLKEDQLREICNRSCADAYSGTMGSIEMDKMLQSWVDCHTGRMLDRDTPELKTDTLSVLELITASYFGASWSSCFWEVNSVQGEFHVDKNETAPCCFMHSSKRMLGCDGRAFTAISKDLQLGYQMWFLLPNEERDLKSVISDPEVLQFLSNPKSVTLEEYDVNLSVPRFDISCKLNIEPIMQSMGICSVFDEDGGNFSPITDAKGLCLSTALHNTRIKVWEEGVDAASFIEMGVAAACAPQSVKKIDFILNRPFIFAITKECRIPMYIGMVVNPQEKESV